MSEKRIAIVTGGGRNIGRKICLRFAEMGYDVGVVVRTNLAEANRVVGEVEALGGRAIAVAADVADSAAVTAMANEVIAAFGGVDILVNTAGIRPKRPLVDLSDELWAETVGVNLSGPMFACRAVLPSMIERGWGSIINVSGLVAFAPATAGSVHIAATKSGLLGMTRALANEYGQYGIRANAIVLSRIETEIQDPVDPAVLSSELARTPLRRLGKDTEIAEVCGFLASDQSSFITGQTIHINGGVFMV
jgi:3-oxoacyl-[acyl-carrier protein] reductase